VLSAATSSTGSYYFGSGSTKFLNYDGTSFSLNGGPFYQHGGSAFFDSDLTLGSLTAAATLRFGNIANKYLNYDGTNFILNGGQLIHHGGNALHDNDMTIGASTTAATLRFGNTGTKYLNYDGINFVFAGGSITGSGASLGNGVYAALSVPLQIGFTGGGTQYGMSFRPAADNTTLQYFVNAAGTNNGSISQTVSAVAYNTASSAELKEDLKSFDAGSIIDQTNVYDFKWKSSSERAYGVIAQQAVDVYPLAVTHSKQDGIDDEFWGVDYSKYVPVLLQELKALRARVADLEGRLISGAQPA
jgi:hypothetical protein